MRLCVFAFVAGALIAQNDSQLTSYTYDVNGRRVPASQQSASSSAGGLLQSDSTQTLNGGTAPLQSIEEKVISEGAGGRVVERLVKRFDPSGNVVGQEKQRIEERVNADGTSTRAVAVFDRDLNGQFQMRMKETSHTRHESETLVKVQTTVETPDVNGRLALQERRQTVIDGDQKKDYRKETTVFRKDANGSFHAQERELTQVQQQDSQTATNTATYNTSATGLMELSQQKVARLTKEADGSETQVTEVYGVVEPGRADGRGPKLREQQIVEKRRDDGGYTESFSIRRPAMDSSKLGPAQRISETVCKGKCQ